ncbi:hypothetical protein NMY22_g19318 [Coprinellus aureogranulatus]|nr:hypothetical protein NMY22_g19318 [Coprinellus aureogranulatus]
MSYGTFTDCDDFFSSGNSGGSSGGGLKKLLKGASLKDGEATGMGGATGGSGGGGGGEKAWTFRARSKEEMMEWWNDLRMLCARYLVASESVRRSGPVERAVLSVGYAFFIPPSSFLRRFLFVSSTLVATVTLTDALLFPIQSEDEDEGIYYADEHEGSSVEEEVETMVIHDNPHTAGYQAGGAGYAHQGAFFIPLSLSFHTSLSALSCIPPFPFHPPSQKSSILTNQSEQATTKAKSSPRIRATRGSSKLEREAMEVRRLARTDTLCVVLNRSLLGICLADELSFVNIRLSSRLLIRSSCTIAAIVVLSSLSHYTYHLTLPVRALPVLSSRRTKSCVVTTLAYQLARHKALHEYKAQLVVAIGENPDITQCDMSCWPRGILYNGLDEVKAVQYHDNTREDLIRKDDDDQVEILEVLHALATSPVFPFRIFVASRPEDNIAHFFSTTARASTIVLFLDSKYKPDADIKRYLQSRFAEIRRRSRISNSSWPGVEAIDQIVEMSSGQFIVPATVLRYIESGLPQIQLEEIMQVAKGQIGAKNPFALLDAVYTHIINRSPDPQLAVIWIRHMITAMELIYPRSCYDSLPAHFWKKFFEDTDGQFYHILKNLASLLSIPPDNDHRSPIKTYHKSLNDFLTSKDRCGDLYVETESLDESSASRYVVILQNRGPKVPLPSPEELHSFLKLSLNSSLFQGSVPLSSRDLRTSIFLEHLREPFISALAACDVGWWTRFAIVHQRNLLEAMHCDIHSVLCRRLDTGANDACLPACIHWRKGILAEARALGWCVHELGEVPLARLSRMEVQEFNLEFMDPILPDQKCAVCQPTTNGQYGLVSFQEEKGVAESKQPVVTIDISLRTPGSPR